MKLISAVILSVTITTSCSLQNIECSSNWKTTGFYTPVFNDFSKGLNKTIKIKDYKSINFNSGFLKAVKMEGWGKTRFGWYLGYYANQWHKEKSPLNALGLPLKVGAIAVDNKIISKSSTIKIPSMKTIFGLEEFKAVDVGSAIKNKHIDIYTGEGDDARKLSYKVSGQHQVCF